MTGLPCDLGTRMETMQCNETQRNMLYWPNTNFSIVSSKPYSATTEGGAELFGSNNQYHNGSINVGATFDFNSQPY